ncbi:MAG: DUF3800 domain-containing protein [Lachnospiraceae bacterium]|nr:DUF3800 domain-containing protein [Lachnospiraceae bacterium]
MKELSIFIDESGDFGEYDYHSPYYIITMVFHDQKNSLTNELQNLENDLTAIGFSKHCIHNGPLIRGEAEYRYVDISLRRKIFNTMVSFVRRTDILYHCFFIEKKHISNEIEAIGKLSKKISFFIQEHYTLFFKYDIIKIYYDNGQIEVTRILSSVFHAHLSNVEFRKVIPSDYRLFQAADMLCTFQLLMLKKENNALSKSEVIFLGPGNRDFNKNYKKPLMSKSL